MVQIIQCDDDKFILQLSKERLAQLINKNRLEAQIVCSSTDCKDIFTFLKKNTGNFLIFLDLDFGEGKLNGIDIAKLVKSANREAKIVFLTNHQEMAMDVLSSGVEPFGFLEKTTDMQKLTRGFLRYVQMAQQAFLPHEQNGSRIALCVGIDEVIEVSKEQIVYLESNKAISHGISYHTIDGSCITVRDTMEHCMEELGESFLRVHRSVLVNARMIVALDGANLRLANGDEVPCAVRMRSMVKKKGLEGRLL